MKDIFDHYIEYSFEADSPSDFKFPQFESNYRRYFPSAKDANMLDIGVGRGEMLVLMQRWGYRAAGVDISPSAVAFCVDKGLSCELAQDTADWLAQRESRYELITCLDVLEHVPREQTIRFLRAIRAALAPGGKAIFQVPNLQSPFGYLHHFNDFTHESGFVEHSLSQVLKAAKFSRFEIHGFEEIYKTTLRSRIRIMLRYFYRRLIRFLRAVNANPNPKILDPVMFAVADR